MRTQNHQLDIIEKTISVISMIVRQKLQIVIMSSTIIASLLVANQKIIIYSGIPILIIGLFGGLINSIIFLSL
jgi:hypothetical protein